MNKRHRLCLISAGLAFAALFAQSSPLGGSTPAQEPGSNIRVESQVVLVDVVVTSAKSKPVLGLTREDFRVAEDGAPQTISSFEEHRLDDAEPVVLPPMPPNVFTNFPTSKSPDSVNVLLLDMLNTQPSDQSVVREQAVKYLTSAPPGTRVAIFALHKNLRLVRGFTTDFSGIAAALDDKTIGARPEVSSLLPTFSKQASENEILRAMVRNMSSPVKIDSVRDYEASRLAEMNASRSEITLEALQALARFLSPIPTRKNVIWFADSFPVSFLPDAKARPAKYQESIQRTSDLLTAGQVSIYPVSASGVVGDARFESTDVRSRVERQPVELETAQISMEAIAQDTGGRAFYSRNGLSEAFATAVNEGAQYYTLAYSPTDARNDGRYRRIEVTAPHTDYKLSYRRGYFADNPVTRKKDEANPEDPLIPLLAFGLPDSDKIICKVEVSPANPQPTRGAPRAGANTELKEPLVRYRVNFAVPVDDLKLAAANDGTRHGHLEVMVVAYDKDGRILNLAKQESNVTIGSEDYSKLQTIGMQLHQDIDVPSGDVMLRAGIFDFNSGNSGTIGMRLASSNPRQKAGKP